MKKTMTAALLILLLSTNANAAIMGITNNFIIATSPDTKESIAAIPGVCEKYAVYINGDTDEIYNITGCGPATFSKVWPLSIGDVTGLTTALAGKFDAPAGTTSQYVRGDGSLATLPSAGSRTFNYPSRALNSCYQISSSKDADFHYKVDVSSGAVLSGTITGTVTATSYTNSGCTTGAQVVADGQASQGAALGLLSVSQIASVSIDGTEAANHWLKITTANTTGAPSFAIRSVQSEVIQP